MLEFLNIEVDNAVAFIVDGKVTKGEMVEIFDEVNTKVEQYGEIVIYEQINNFGGAELSAIVEELKYLFDNGFKQIKKVAVVTDKKWVEPIAKIEDKIFSSIDIQCFHLDEKEQAVAFLKA